MTLRETMQVVLRREAESLRRRADVLSHFGYVASANRLRDSAQQADDAALWWDAKEAQAVSAGLRRDESYGGSA